MFSDEVFFDFFGFLLVLRHFLIPEVVELSNFLNMGHLNLLFLFFMFDKHLVTFVLFKVNSHFGESFFGKIGLNILARLFALFLMSVQDFPE